MIELCSRSVTVECSIIEKKGKKSGREQKNSNRSNERERKKRKREGRGNRMSYHCFEKQDIKFNFYFCSSFFVFAGCYQKCYIAVLLFYLFFLLFCSCFIVLFFFFFFSIHFFLSSFKYVRTKGKQEVNERKKWSMN